MFRFAEPGQVLSAVNVYTCHFYGAMLWDLFGEGAGQLYRSWNTCVKLAWDLPRSTHNYLVDNLLSGSLPSVRQKLLCQYIGFYQKLRSSASWEVRILANIVGSDAASVTGKNLCQFKSEFNLCPWTDSIGSFKKMYMGYQVPAEDMWRLPFLLKLINQRREMFICDEDSSSITELINSLCTS